MGERIEIVGNFSKIEKKEQALAVILSLEGRPREAALVLLIEEVNADDGHDKLIAKLDEHFLKDKHQRKYIAYAEFEYQRAADMSIEIYINDFERLYKIKAFKIELRSN